MISDQLLAQPDYYSCFSLPKLSLSSPRFFHLSFTPFCFWDKVVAAFAMAAVAVVCETLRLHISGTVLRTRKVWCNLSTMCLTSSKTFTDMEIRMVLMCNYCWTLNTNCMIGFIPSNKTRLGLVPVDLAANSDFTINPASFWFLNIPIRQEGCALSVSLPASWCLREGNQRGKVLCFLSLERSAFTGDILQNRGILAQKATIFIYGNGYKFLQRTLTFRI